MSNAATGAKRQVSRVCLSTVSEMDTAVQVKEKDRQAKEFYEVPKEK